MRRRSRPAEPAEVYFDANGVSKFFPPGDDNLARHHRQALRVGVRDLHLRVIVSAALFQELVPIGDANWSAYRKMMRFLREVSEPRLMLHTNELVAKEARLGRALRGNERLVDKDLSQRSWAAAMDRTKVPAITHEASAVASEQLAKALRLRDEVTASIDRIKKPDESIAAELRKWWGRDPAARIAEVVQGSAVDLALPLGHPLHDLRAFWYGHAYSYARIVATHGKRAEAIKLGDVADLHHYIAASYVSIFVSDDGPLTRAAASIPGGPKPITFAAFAHRYLR